MADTKRGNWKNAGMAIFAAIFCGLIIFIIFLLTTENRTEITSSTETFKMTSLTCNKLGADNEYFNEEGTVVDGEHEVRANFSNDELVDLMYIYKATYSGGTDLVHMKDVAEANFNLAYGNTYVYKDNLWSASFTVDKNKDLVKMSVYAGAGSLDSNVAKVFQLERENVFPKTVESMRSAYENTGFSCSVSQEQDNNK